MPLLAGIFDAFVNPWLLSGLALLSAPVIIHILNKRHYTVVEWAAMDFLLLASSKNRRRLRFEDLILLLLRMALIALLVFSVARPLVRGFGGTREDERIVILDDSFSMEASDGTGTAFAAAKAAAVSQIEDAVGRSIPVSLWSGTMPEMGSIDLEADGPEGGPGAAQATREAAARLLGTVRSREAMDLSLRFGPILTRLIDRLEAKKDKDAAARSIMLVSDFRAADWFEEGGTVLRSEVAAAIAEAKSRGLLDSIRWKFVDTGQPGRENCAVTGVRFSTDHPLAKVPVRIVVEVRNFGAEERKHVTGEIEVSSWEGEIVSSSATPPGGTAAETRRAAAGLKVLHRIPLPAIESILAGKTATSEVELTFEKAGKYPITARIEADRLARDDASLAVAHVQDGLRTLVVDGDPGQGRFSGDSGFLLAAVAPRGSVPSGILPRRFTGEVTRKELRDADVVLILNRTGFSPGEQEALEDFAHHGGGVAFFLGSRVQPDTYRGLAVFPAVLGAVREAPSRSHLRIGEKPHAAFQVFRGVEGSSLEQVGFDRYFVLEPAQGAAIAARFDDPDGTAAIVDSPRLKGRAAVFNMTADRDWNDWPTDPSYPIVLQEWIRYLAPRRAEAAALVAGDVLSWEPAAGVKYEVVPPTGPAVPVGEAGDTAGSAASAATAQSAASVASAVPVAFGATHRAGLYVVVPTVRAQGTELAADALEPRLHACRRDTRDSNLEPAGESRLRSALGAAGVEIALGRDTGVDAFEKKEEGETWRWLAYGAAAFLLVELLTAWWFGRR